MTGDIPGAADALAQALEIYRATGNRLGEANALTDLGSVRHPDRGLPGAVDALDPGAGDLPRDRQPPRRGRRPDRPGARATLTGDLRRGRRRPPRALEIYRATGHRHGEANALTNLGQVRRLTGDLAGAATPRPGPGDLPRRSATATARPAP